MERAGRSLSASGAKREPSRDLRQLRRLAAFMAPYRLQVVAALIALVMAAGSLLSLGVGLRYVIDGGFVARREGALDHAVEAVLIVILVLAAATFLRSYMVTWLGERVVADLRRAVYARMLRLSPGLLRDRCAPARCCRG